jgi:septal ring factor EnvC (AmiA/AmiB activator)
MARQELNELKESLRYAEYLLQRTRQEKEQVEGELARHDEKVDAVRREVRDKENENSNL